MRCDLCKEKNCDNGSPCFTKESEALYQNTVELEMMRAASSIEAEYYGELNRIQEIILFAKRLGYKKIGLAFCIGLSEEAARVCEILTQYFEVHSVCCKTCSIPKASFKAEGNAKVGFISCNPAEQARILKESGTELNLLLGLCVGHDALFIKHSHAYVVPLAAKDRVTGHNPLAAVYASAVFGKMKKTDMNNF